MSQNVYILYRVATLYNCYHASLNHSANNIYNCHFSPRYHPAHSSLVVGAIFGVSVWWSDVCAGSPSWRWNVTRWSNLDNNVVFMVQFTRLIHRDFAYVNCYANICIYICILQIYCSMSGHGPQAMDQTPFSFLSRIASHLSNWWIVFRYWFYGYRNYKDDGEPWTWGTYDLTIRIEYKIYKTISTFLYKKLYNTKHVLVL